MFAAAMIVEYWIEFRGTPPFQKAQASRFALIRSVGKTAYITCWIITGQTVVASSCAIAEVSLLTPWPQPALLAASYSLGVFTSTLGVLLTLMFLKLCYFDEGWRVQSLKYWEERGFPLRRNTLLCHCFSLPVGLLDILFKAAAYLRLCSPPFWLFLFAVEAFGNIYNVYIHIVHLVTGLWPYPILDRACVRASTHLAAYVGGMVAAALLASIVYIFAVLVWTARNGLSPPQ
eukprot:NODE_11363_length_1291_cov_6.167526.p1 GENE.NODE_11363_length_1291_cov_6.167526~~NODE_11363_length_1291_cov_6.167526.p1  ORF type:complete len:256 (-),score=80.68 NODE_11363_length_1291_cov_6.167526:522-1217(-)